MMPARRLSIALVATLIFGISLAPAHAFGSEVLSPAEAVRVGTQLDGTSVTIEGEAIGESLRAGGDERWVNVLGGGTAVGVVMTREEAARIETLGLYDTTGDTLRVTGVLEVASNEYGGQFVIKASSVEIVERGSTREHPIAVWKGLVGLIAALAALVLMRVFRYRQERRPG